MNRTNNRLLLRLSFVLAALVLFGTLAGKTAEAAPQPAPMAQVGGTVAVARVDSVNVRSGPSTGFPVVGVLSFGQSCPVIGRDTFSGWWLLQCPANLTGWVSPDLVNIVGNPNSVPLYTVTGPMPAPVQPTPTPPPPPTGWSASYFANRDLQGSPVLALTVPDINFNWGFGSPGPTVPVDFFSARFQRTMRMAPGFYLFTLGMDDGARLFIDGELILNDWRIGSFRQLGAVRYIDGNPHTYVVEYFEDTGQAALQLTITPTAPPQPQPQPPQPGPGAIPQNQWLVQYFNNTDLAGGPLVTQFAPRGAFPLDLDWGYGSPAPGINADYFSARFEGIFYFDAGDYQFFARSDDGVRLYINNILVIDAWWDGFKESTNAFRRIGSGNHTIRIEFYERTGAAFVRAWWSRFN
ncbi:MAG: PA14 domain-containing protein [Caldilinea sp.]